MQHLIWLLVLVLFVVIVLSLGSALYHLARGTPEDSARLSRALTVRITLSIVLFVLLILAWYFGLISPHTLQGAASPPHP